MKRAGFTMIELIFVIVILGILASVAVPKLIGVKDSAEEGLVKGFVGTLNRTVGPAKWSQSLMNGDDGSINTATYNIIESTDTDFPSDFQNVTYDATKALASTATARTATSVVLDGTLYEIVMRDGNATNSPRFWYAKKSDANTTATLDDQKLKL